MIFISKTCWKKSFEATLRKQQQLAPSIEHPLNLPLKLAVKLKSFIVTKILQNTVKM